MLPHDNTLYCTSNPSQHQSCHHQHLCCDDMMMMMIDNDQDSICINYNDDAIDKESTTTTCAAVSPLTTQFWPSGTKLSYFWSMSKAVNINH